VSVHASAVELLSRWPAPDFAQDALRKATLAFLLARPDGHRRDCRPGHITGSTLLLDSTGTRALLSLHPRLRRWVQLGGHCEDTDADIVAAARREAVEESGIAGLVMTPDLAAICVYPVTCSLGVPTRHLDLQFIAHAPDEAAIVCSAESVDLRWWPLHALPAGIDDGLRHLVSLARRPRGS
jgi:8-oxo-dGTP pyrophosphatase MutT (NUDIX family)